MIVNVMKMKDTTGGTTSYQILLTGDVAFRYMPDNLLSSCNLVGLVAVHHGSKTGVSDGIPSPRILRGILPNTPGIIYSYGCNGHHHPNPDAINIYKSRGWVQAMYTPQGDIAFTSQAGMQLSVGNEKPIQTKKLFPTTYSKPYPTRSFSTLSSKKHSWTFLSKRKIETPKISDTFSACQRTSYISSFFKRSKETLSMMENMSRLVRMILRK